MEWTLIVTLMLNGTPKKVAVEPLGWISCNIMESSILEKELKLEFDKIEVIKAECVKTG